MIGWEGGQPVTQKDGTTLSIGFSGFRGTNDLEIVVKAQYKEQIYKLTLYLVIKRI